MLSNPSGRKIFIINIYLFYESDDIGHSYLNFAETVYTLLVLKKIASLQLPQTVEKTVFKGEIKPKRNVEKSNSVLWIKVCPKSIQAVTEERSHRNTSSCR